LLSCSVSVKEKDGSETEGNITNLSQDVGDNMVFKRSFYLKAMIGIH